VVFKRLTQDSIITKKRYFRQNVRGTLSEP
jgi:hypothetical protein